MLDYRHHIEADLLSKINATLEPLLGANRFRAGISVECDFTGGEQSEEIFDPSRSVMVTSQRTEDATSSGTASGVPGTAATLPRPTSRPTNGSKGVSRMTENISYQTSRTVKKTRLPAGGVRKMSLAILVDQDVTWQPDKKGFQRVLVPPTPEKLKIIHDLVAGITGFSAERGDQLVIETLPFETTLLLEPPPLPAVPVAPAKPVTQKLGPLQMDRRTLTMGGGALAVLIVLAVAFLLFKRKRRKKTSVSVHAALPAGESSPSQEVAALGAPIEDQIESKLAEREEQQRRLDAQTLNALKLSPVITKTAEVLAKHLREKIKQEPEISAQILRTWIREEES